MGLLDWYDDRLEDLGGFAKSVLDQVNPFDKGRTFSTLGKDREVENTISDVQAKNLAQNPKPGISKIGVQTPTIVTKPDFAPPTPDWFNNYRNVDAYARNRVLDQEQDFYVSKSKKLQKVSIGGQGISLNSYLESLKAKYGGGLPYGFVRTLSRLANEGDKTAADTLAAMLQAGVADIGIWDRIARTGRTTLDNIGYIAADIFSLGARPVSQALGFGETFDQFRQALEEERRPSLSRDARIAQNLGQLGATLGVGAAGGAVGGAATRGVAALTAGRGGVLGAVGRGAATKAGQVIGAEIGAEVPFALAEAGATGQVDAGITGLGIVGGILPELGLSKLGRLVTRNNINFTQPVTSKELIVLKKLDDKLDKGEKLSGDEINQVINIGNGTDQATPQTLSLFEQSGQTGLFSQAVPYIKGFISEESVIEPQGMLRGLARAFMTGDESIWLNYINDTMRRAEIQTEGKTPKEILSEAVNYLTAAEKQLLTDASAVITSGDLSLFENYLPNLTDEQQQLIRQFNRAVIAQDVTQPPASQLTPREQELVKAVDEAARTGNKDLLNKFTAQEIEQGNLIRNKNVTDQQVTELVEELDSADQLAKALKEGTPAEKQIAALMEYVNDPTDGNFNQLELPVQTEIAPEPVVRTSGVALPSNRRIGTPPPETTPTPETTPSPAPATATAPVRAVSEVDTTPTPPTTPVRPQTTETTTPTQPSPPPPAAPPVPAGQTPTATKGEEPTPRKPKPRPIGERPTGNTLADEVDTQTFQKVNEKYELKDLNEFSVAQLSEDVNIDEGIAFALNFVASKGEAIGSKNLLRMGEKAIDLGTKPGRHQRLQFEIEGELTNFLKEKQPVIFGGDKGVVSFLNLLLTRTEEGSAQSNVIKALLQQTASQGGRQLANVKLYKDVLPDGSINPVSGVTRVTLDQVDLNTLDSTKRQEIEKVAIVQAKKQITKDWKKNNATLEWSADKESLIKDSVSRVLDAKVKIPKELRNQQGQLDLFKARNQISALELINNLQRNERALEDAVLSLFKTPPPKKSLLKRASNFYTSAVLSGPSTITTIATGGALLKNMERFSKDLGTAIGRGVSALTGGKVFKAEDLQFSISTNFVKGQKNNLRAWRNLIKGKTFRRNFSKIKTQYADEGSNLVQEMIGDGYDTMKTRKLTPDEQFSYTVTTFIDSADEFTRQAGRRDGYNEELRRLFTQYQKASGKTYTQAKQLQSIIDDLIDIEDLDKAMKARGQLDDFIKQVVKAEQPDLTPEQLLVAADKRITLVERRVKSVADLYAAQNSDAWWGIIKPLRRAAVKHPGLRLLFPVITGPASISEFAFNYAPGLGLLKLIPDITLKHKRDIELSAGRIVATRLGQQLSGTLSVGFIGYQLYQNGMLTLDYPANESERDEWRRTGKRPYSIKTPLGWMDMAWAFPLIPGLSAGAVFNQFQNDDLPGKISPSFQNFLLTYGKKVFEGALEHPFFTLVSNVQDLDFAKVPANIVTGFQPNFLKQIARAIDPKAKLPGDFSEGPEAWWNRFFAQNIPGLRNTVENRLAFGAPYDEAGLGGLGALTPWKFSNQTDVDGNQYAADREWLKHWTDDPFDRNFTITELDKSELKNVPGETPSDKKANFDKMFRGKNPISDKEIRVYAEQTKREIYNEIDRFVNTDQYKKADQPTQKALIKKIISQVKSAKKKSLYLNYDIELTSPLTENEKRILGIVDKPPQYYIDEKPKELIIDELRTELLTAPVLEQPKLIRRIQKLTVEKLWQDRDKDEIVEIYGYSRNDIGRYLNQINLTQGKQAAENLFKQLVQLGDDLWESGAEDKTSPTFRNSDGEIVYPGNYINRPEGSTGRRVVGKSINFGVRINRSEDSFFSRNRLRRLRSR